MHKHLVTILLLLVFWLVPLSVQARMVHDFDCTFCHLDYSSEQVPYMTFNICLDCHYPGNEGTTYQRSDGSDSNPITATFTAGDGSDAMGSNSAPGAETSHYFAGTSDNQPAAGATPPTNFRFNLGWANGQITCSRCHNPHGDTNNPKLLKLGADSTDAMCLDCHTTWDQTNNHGLGSHPMHDDYPTLAAANPDKFKAAPDNFGTEGTIALIDDTKVSCSSCHGVHWVDSDDATADGKAQAEAGNLSSGDGKLLKFDGAGRENPAQSLCKTCHTYDQHGGDTSQGCMVCHGGHEYDAGGNPNYFMLKKQVALDPIPKTGAAGTVDLEYTSYPAPYDLDGVCQECHTLSADHVDGYTCTDCHQHSTGFTHVSGSGGYGCETCHAPDHVVNSGQANWVTVFGPSATHSNDLGSNNPGPIYVYATCSLCHTTNLLSQHANDCQKCHAGASPPAESFGGAPWDQTCQQGSCHPSYHTEASNLHDDYYWNARTGTDGANCNNCHGSGFIVPWPWNSDLPGYVATASDCGKCHKVGNAAPAMGADSVAPVTHSDLQAAYYDTAVINIWATDARAIKAIYYRLDSGPIQTLDGGPLTIAPPASGSQAHTLEYWARDWTGNTETPHNSGAFTVTKDTTPPVTTSDAKATYGGEATIQLSSSDNATSYDVAATYYKVGSGGTVETGSTIVIPEPTSGSVDYTIYFWSVDHSGNVEDTKNASFTVVKDEVAPSTTSDLQPAPHYYGRPELRDNSYLDITLTSVDPEPASDVAGIQVTSSNNWMRYESDNEADWNGSAWEIAVYFIGDGMFPISYAARDHSGNVEEIKTTTIAVDRSRPDTESDAVSAYAGTATIFLTATDNFSGVDTIYYQIDSSGPTQVYNPAVGIVIPPPASGSVDYRIFFWAVDFAGNIEDKYSNNVFDTNRASFTIWPEGTDIAPPTGSVTINSGDDWTDNAAVTLTLAATDSDGTLTDMQFSNDGSTWSGWESYATSKAWTLSSGNGTKTVYVQFRDAAGHVSTSYSDTIGYDITAPATTINAVAGNTYFSDNFSGIKTFTLSASDSNSGIASTWWQLDGTGGAWTSGTAVQVPAPASGTADHTIYWYAIDNADNQESQKSVTITMEAGGLAETGLLIGTPAWIHVNDGASGPWANYTIYLDGVHIGGKSANTTSSWTLAAPVEITGAGVLSIVINAGFTSYGYLYDDNLPATYSVTLPAGATRLETATWGGFPNKVTGRDFHEWYDDYYEFVSVGAGYIYDITYVTTTPP